METDQRSAKEIAEKQAESEAGVYVFFFTLKAVAFLTIYFVLVY